jgi:hypothetical protein
MLLEKPKMCLSTWYGGALRIPTYSSWFFPGFAAGCLGLIRSVLRREMDTQISIRFCQIPTASADQENGIININSEFLGGRVGRGRKPLNSEDALTLIAGIVIHEAAHFAWSPPKLTDSAEFIKEFTPFPYNEKLALGLSNIIEDIFIEAEAEREVPSLFWTLEYMRTIFHPEEEFLKDVDLTQEITEPPTSMGDVINLVNLLINAKLREEIVSNPWVTALYHKALSARVTLTVPERYSLTLEIYNLLMENITEEECEGGSSGKEGDEELLGELLSSILGATADHSKDATFVNLGKSEYERGSLTDLLEKTVDAEFSLQAIDSGFEYKDVLFVERPLSPVENTVVIDARYNQLAEMARQRSTTNRPYGLDMNRGHSIRKLHRIATDSKIFAEPVRMGNYSPLRACILVDCSGSMSFDSKRAFGSDGTKLSRFSRIGRACEAAAGAALGLVEGRSEVAVFGHTADVLKGTNDVTIYRFKDFNEPIESLPARLSVVKDGELLEQNKDGFAIHYVARKLLGSSKKKLLIVISDGAPYAPRYAGGKAQEHTRDMVDQARAWGIEVVSISISEDARETNDFIYGRHKNVYNEDPNCIADIVRSIYL